MSMDARHTEKLDRQRSDDMEELHKVHEDGGILYDDELRKLVEEACDWDWDVPNGRLRLDATSANTSVTFDFFPEDFDAEGEFTGSKTSRNGCINVFLEAMGNVDPDIEEVGEDEEELMFDACVARSAVGEVIDTFSAWVRGYYDGLKKAAELGQLAFNAALAGDLVRVQQLSSKIEKLGDIAHAENRWYWWFAAEALARRAKAFHPDARVVALRTFLSRREDDSAADRFWTEVGPTDLLEILRNGSSDVVASIQELLAEVPTEEPAMSVSISVLASIAVSIDGTHGDWATGILAKALREGDDPDDALLESSRSILLTTLNISRRVTLIDALLARLRRELGLTSGK
jgi:hypothetical protein